MSKPTKQQITRLAHYACTHLSGAQLQGFQNVMESARRAPAMDQKMKRERRKQALAQDSATKSYEQAFPSAARIRTAL